jgi:hypothetical protein
LAESGLTVHHVLNGLGKNEEWNFKHGKGCFLTKRLKGEIMDKPAFAVVPLAVVKQWCLVDFDDLSVT